MEIYEVRPGDCLYRIAQRFGVPMAQLLRDNQLPDPAHLCVGQAIVVQFPRETYTVRAGDTLSSIAAAHGLSVRQLLRRNFGLSVQEFLYPGQTLVLSFGDDPDYTLSVNSYAYPSIDRELLYEALPYLTALAPFTYGLDARGGLLPLDDGRLISAARSMGAKPVMHLSTLTETGDFSMDHGREMLRDTAVQDKLLKEIWETIRSKDYRGLDLDLEYIGGEDARAYARFVARARALLVQAGLPVLTALAPKTFREQPGDLYEGHDYRLLGQAADRVLLMTYEWGYAYGPPMAVAPIRNVRQVVEYALTEISPEKIWLGMPTYGYDWTLPYQQGTGAVSLSAPQALELAVRYRAAIQYDQTAQSPWFRYTDQRGLVHEVWFEDARSIRAKLALTREYGLSGVGLWDLKRPFAQGLVTLNALYDIREEIL